ncbi:unnamed protein product [Darwinula stevensoni]|uniref:PPM-type phosphatase domain-containing protein n=1 Tax=Darwinula stevensoni TaxID=69355 RepID=A0A7R8XI67_9CRUS|nr:unnamed protein product [Darwinula stevensoni]CAG0891034.1 unnamed protein product [Darwinula stevensoni]
MPLVSSILRREERTIDARSEGPVKTFATNQLASNTPIEDVHVEAECLLQQGLLFGTFDGHGGPACARMVSRRLLHYLAAALLPVDILRQNYAFLKGTCGAKLLDLYDNEGMYSIETKNPMYRALFDRYLEDILQMNGFQSIEDAFHYAFVRVDSDMSTEIIQSSNVGTLSSELLSVAISGAVTCVAYVQGSNLFVANLGDCAAYLGVNTSPNTWVPKKLTLEHSCENASEVLRVLLEHPEAEKETVIKQDRLLGQLAPLRALGDFRYKWDLATQRKLLLPFYGQDVIPPNYYSPPYLSSIPDVVHHKLNMKDHFLVIATDGLWEQMLPTEVIQLIGEHMGGHVSLGLVKIPPHQLTLADVNKMLMERKKHARVKPMDLNGATHLIRSALGGCDFGIDQQKLADSLALPDDIVRLYRDDITVVVLYFDIDFLRQHATAFN